MKIVAYCWDGVRLANGTWRHWSAVFPSWPQFIQARGNVTASEARLLQKFYRA